MNIFKTLPTLLLLAIPMLTLTSCDKENPDLVPPSKATEKYAGTYSGEVAVTVGGQFTYSTNVEIKIESRSDDSIDVWIPSYALDGTMMGNLTLGALAITDLKYDSNKDAYLRSYGNQGILRHFKAMQGPAVTMEGYYPLNDPSEISIHFNSDNTLTLTNSYKLGEMPFSLSAEFSGSKGN